VVDAAACDIASPSGTDGLRGAADRAPSVRVRPRKGNIGAGRNGDVSGGTADEKEPEDGALRPLVRSRGPEAGMA
jgi:hypothetical protein